MSPNDTTIETTFMPSPTKLATCLTVWSGCYAMIVLSALIQ